MPAPSIRSIRTLTACRPPGVRSVSEHCSLAPTSRGRSLGQATTGASVWRWAPTSSLTPRATSSLATIGTAAPFPEAPQAVAPTASSAPKAATVGRGSTQPSVAEPAASGESVVVSDLGSFLDPREKSHTCSARVEATQPLEVGQPVHAAPRIPVRVPLSAAGGHRWLLPYLPRGAGGPGWRRG